MSVTPIDDRALAAMRSDALMTLLEQHLRKVPGYVPPPVLADLVREQYAAGYLAPISSRRNETPAAASLEVVQAEWLTPTLAGSQVGLSVRRVQQLVAGGLLPGCWHIDGRTVLISKTELTNHLRGVA